MRSVRQVSAICRQLGEPMIDKDGRPLRESNYLRRLAVRIPLAQRNSLSLLKFGGAQIWLAQQLLLRVFSIRRLAPRVARSGGRLRVALAGRRAQVGHSSG